MSFMWWHRMAGIFNLVYNSGSQSVGFLSVRASARQEGGRDALRTSGHEGDSFSNLWFLYSCVWEGGPRILLGGRFFTEFENHWSRVLHGSIFFKPDLIGPIHVSNPCMLSLFNHAPNRKPNVKQVSRPYPTRIKQKTIRSFESDHFFECFLNGTMSIADCS